MEKRFVSIWFPYLLTDWCDYTQPGLKDTPFVISASTHGRMVIKAVNPEATTKGIYIGMALADARAIWPGLKSLDDKPGLADKLLTRIAEWAIRFSPLPAVDPLGGIIMDATGCVHLWGSEQDYLADILQRLDTKGFQARAGMAGTIGSAWALARYGRMMIAEPGRHTGILPDLPAAALRLEAATLDRLQKLGLQRVADFISMPRTALRRRFGPHLLLRLDQATGLTEEHLVPVRPAEPWQEHLPCLEPVARIEGFEIALRVLLERLCQRLRSEGKGLRAATLRCLKTDGKENMVSIVTSAPSCNEKHIFHLFSLKLGTIMPGNGIDAFILTAGQVETHRPYQGQYWKTGGNGSDQDISELIDRLSGKLGPDIVRRYLPDDHYWPERSFRKAVSTAEQPTTKWRNDKPRPLHLLAVPERIEVTAPIPDYPPMLFRYRGKLHKVARADGPERIEQEWWIQEGQHRDYYAVEDESGGRYWIFRLGHYDQEKTYSWYIHGLFV